MARVPSHRRGRRPIAPHATVAGGDVDVGNGGDVVGEATGLHFADVGGGDDGEVGAENRAGTQRHSSLTPNIVSPPPASRTLVWGEEREGDIKNTGYLTTLLFYL